MFLCDIYGEHCKICGEVYSFHLGDYETSRFEILFICEKHVDNPYLLYALERLRYSYCVWSSPSGNYIVIALTKNAWRNRRYNHQNISETELLREIKDGVLPFYFGGI